MQNLKPSFATLRQELQVPHLIFAKARLSDLARQTGVRWCPSPDMSLTPKKCLGWTHFVHFHWLKFLSLKKAAHPSNYGVVKQPNPAPPFTFKMFWIICCRPARSPAPNFFKSSSYRNAAAAVGWDRGIECFPRSSSLFRQCMKVVHASATNHPDFCATLGYFGPLPAQGL